MIIVSYCTYLPMLNIIVSNKSEGERLEYIKIIILLPI
jgi:hypothetical protein